MSRYLKINVTEMNISWLKLNRIHTHTVHEMDILASLNMLSVLSAFFVGKRTGRHYNCDCGESIPLYRCSVPGSSSRIPLIVLVPPRATIDDLGTIADCRDFSNFALCRSRYERLAGKVRYITCTFIAISTAVYVRRRTIPEVATRVP